MSDKYVLVGHTAKPASLLEWANWFETNNRHVAHDKVGDVLVSTVFLGLDHSFGEGPPLLFETMIFGGPHDGYQDRCTTWEQAVEMHKRGMARASWDRHDEQEEIARTLMSECGDERDFEP